MKATMGRRDFLRAVGAGATAFAMPGCRSLARGTRPAANGTPNIVYILADDMGYGDLACQNPESKIPTPNLDQLAREGVRFTDAHSPSAVCTPTRYGLLTGRYCWRTRLKNSVLWPWAPPLIEAERLTVPKLLKRHGYHTACIGKWHLGWDWPSKSGEPVHEKDSGDDIDFSKPIANGPTARGFDYYFGTAVPNFPPYCFIENDHTLGDPTLTKPEGMFGWPGPMLPGWDLVDILPGLTGKAVEYIDQRAAEPKRPFFLYMPLTAPHTPIVPAPEFIGKSQAGLYGDFVHQVDWTVGQVLNALKRHNLEEDTLVIFTSDNGSPARNGQNACGPPGSCVTETGHNPSWILRGMKADIWDGGHRVPFLARWPKHITPGTTNGELICHTDLMATCAALLGEPLPNGAAEDSYNVLPALLGEELSAPIREAVVHHSGGGAFAIRQGKWKLITQLGSGGWTKPGSAKPEPGGPRGQLYDMEADLSERKNLWLDQPEVVKHLTSLLEKYKREGRSTPLRAKKGLTQARESANETCLSLLCTDRSIH
jgi:arylsulfatase A